MKHLLGIAFVTAMAASPFISCACALGHTEPLSLRAESLSTTGSYFVAKASAARNVQLAYQLPRTAMPQTRMPMGMQMNTGIAQPLSPSANRTSVPFHKIQMTYTQQSDNGALKSQPFQKRRSSIKGGPKLVRLKIDGIAGESADDKHKGEIHINRHSRRRDDTSPTEHVQLNYNSVRH